MLKLFAVEYLNTLPFISGLKTHGLEKELIIRTATPANCAAALESGEADIALLPVGAISQFEELFSVSKYCIGCDGKVRTVCIYSNMPLQQIKSIQLDGSSRTSNLLVEILIQHFWKRQDIRLVAPDEIGEIPDAYLIIGDASFKAESMFTYTYDLGEAWKEMTNLPFVFAIWVSKKILDPDFLEKLNFAFERGINNPMLGIESYDGLMPQNLQTYYQDNISYDFDKKKQESLLLFCKYVGIDSRRLHYYST